jgi:hypothetical protein
LCANKAEKGASPSRLSRQRKSIAAKNERDQTQFVTGGKCTLYAGGHCDQQPISVVVDHIVTVPIVPLPHVEGKTDIDDVVIMGLIGEVSVANIVDNVVEMPGP